MEPNPLPFLGGSVSDSVAVDPAARRKQLIKTLAGFIFPLFFVVIFPLAYVSSLHNPSPAEMQLTVVGPTAVVGQIAESLDETDRFSVTRTDVESRAKEDVEDRSSVGSILVSVDASTGDLSMTVFTASGGGRAAAAVVQGAANQIAAELDVVPAVKDVAPLDAPDVIGTNLFFLLTYSSIGSYLLIVILTLLLPKASFAVKYAAVALASVVLPLLVFGLMAIFVGDYHASFQEIVGVLLIDALYVFTVGSLSIMLQNLAGQAAIILLMGLVVFINLPSSGGPMPVSMLPPFWQWLHSFWFGAGALEGFRSIIYFDGNQAGRWVAQLASWAVVITSLSAVVELFKANRALRRRLDGKHHKHEIESTPPTLQSPVTA
jgi:hypothetical protein